MSKAKGIPALNQMLDQEQSKLANNVLSLANYYTPFGHLPDQDDFELMAKKVESEGNIMRFWPEASSRLVEVVTNAVTYITMQKEAIEGLKAAGAVSELSNDDLFKAAVENSRQYQRVKAQAQYN